MARNDENSSPENNFPFYPNAESYEAENSSIELQIKALKNQITRELEDDLLRLQYILNAKERELALRELALNRREEELNAREQRLLAQERFDESLSPKQLAEEYKGKPEDEFNFDEETGTVSSRDYIPNESGKGGLPGSKNNPSRVITRNVYEGDKIDLEDGSTLLWDKQKSEYQLISKNQGLKFTYFAVEAAYLNEGYINHYYPQFYSQTILRKQVWYEKTPRNRESDGLGEQYLGKVPLDVLRSKLNQAVNTVRVRSDGNLEENVDFTFAYKNWRYRYETGTYYKDAAGELYTIVDFVVVDSKGNAPNFRTDGNFKSPSYGQRKPVSADEKLRWGTKLNNSKFGKGKK